MKILFHTNSINHRGTTTAVSDYAKYNRDILGNESFICYNKSLPNEKEMGNVPEIIQQLKTQYEVVGYDDPKEINKLTENVDAAYFIRAGAKEFLPTNTKTLVHAVFQMYDPHGDRYAYVSEWLAKKMMSENPLWVPHIVDLPEPNKDLREKLNIPKDAFVFGRYGGYDAFDLPFVHQQIQEFLNSHKNVYFAFANTRPFVNHPNVRYIKEINTKQGKSNFIAACNAMIHARHRGESFGLSVAEFLFHDKPVVAWTGGLDQNHVEMLNGSQILYTEQNFKDKLLYAMEENKESNKWRVEQFSPSNVINKFKEVFLDGLNNTN